MIRTWLRDMRDGARILRSREFWRAFRHYWSDEEVAKRIDAWVERNRRRGQ